MRIYIKNIYGQILADEKGDESIDLIYTSAFELGDVVVFETSQPFVTISIDSLIPTSNVYIPKGRFEYAIPFGEKRKAYPGESFLGDEHNISIHKTPTDIIQSRRNLAMNPLDKRDIATCFPHSDANIMTRDEAGFESRNAIDGFKDNEGHGQFPYQSWGGGLRDDLEFELYFGREVLIDQIDITLRADYVNDHDINWESGFIVFSDGSELPLVMTKTTSSQTFTFPQKKVNWIKLNRLKREKSSAFSALSQIEVFGTESE